MNVHGEDVLNRIRRLPISSWNYVLEGTQSRHIGPVTEDFYNAFGFGTSDTSIPLQDLGGVTLAATQALEQRTAQLQAETAQMEEKTAEVSRLTAQLQALTERVARMEALQQKQ